MRKYFFAIEIGPVEKGKLYFHVPLHCTIMHWFRVDLTPEQVMEVAALALEGLDSVELVSDAFALFGRSRDIPVHSIVASEALMTLHTKLFAALNGVGVEYAEPEYVGNGYRPHSTTQEERSFPVGSRHILLKRSTKIRHRPRKFGVSLRSIELNPLSPLVIEGCSFK